jgi:myo-inositol-1(or 4)-monophosphatase
MTDITPAFTARIKAIMCQASQTAILPRYQSLAAAQIVNKAADDVVTIADTESEAILTGLLGDLLPEATIVGEEAAFADATIFERLRTGLCWIVDPLDGTNNFAHKIPHFAVSIAYYRAGQPQCGVVFNPIRDEWHTAVRGQGAIRDGRRMQVADHTRLDEALVGVGFYYDRDVMMDATLAAIADLKRSRIHGIRRFGTASLDLCMVGLGQFGAYFEYTLSPWDFAAGRLIVEEAGGRVTTCRGETPPLAPSTILASNGALHEAMLEIVRAHHPGEPG